MLTNQNYTDKDLFGLIGQADETAFRELFHKYTPLLFPGVMQMVKQEEVAREIVQEVFLKVWLKKELLGAMEQPVGWMFRVASNLAISHLRKLSTQLKWAEASIGSEESTEDPADGLSLKELQHVLREAVNALPPQRKLIFRLSREEGLSHDEIAARLQLSGNTVKNQVSIASKFVKTYISNTIGLSVPLWLLFY